MVHHIYHAAFTLPNGGLRESDMYMSPLTRLRDDPTLVLEVGHSKHTSELRLGAKRWLSRTPPVRCSVQLALDVLG
jgi:hypothetical protein